MAVDKSTWNKKVKVSQSTIDDIKRLGMSKALRLAKENAAGPQKGLVAEYQEATRRLYGDKRFAAATGAKPKKASTSYSPAPMKSAATKKPSTSYSPAPMKTPAKKGVSGATFLKGYAGTAAAVGILALGKGKGAGIAAKLAPGLMRNRAAQALLTGEIKKAAPKVIKKAAVKPKTISQSSYDTMVTAKSGQKAAAAGRGVTPEQFSAMSTAAKGAIKKAPAKKTAPKKTAAAPKISRWDANAPKPRTPKKPKK